jgi:hypothetical protein
MVYIIILHHMTERGKTQVREPVQVYLTTSDRKLLREVATAAGMSAAEVLRRGLRRMAGEVLADRNPALRLLEEMNAAEWPDDLPSDAAKRHDEQLAQLTYPAARKAGRKGR